MAAIRPSARAMVLRSALLFTPFLAIALAAMAFIALDARGDGASAGRVVALVLVGLVSILLAYQVIQSVRDLFARPVELTGVVDRRWSRNDIVIFRNDYLFLGGTVFRVSPERFIEVDVGDTIRVVHYPPTCTVLSIELVARAGSQEQPSNG